MSKFKFFALPADNQSYDGFVKEELSKKSIAYQDWVTEAGQILKSANIPLSRVKDYPQYDIIAKGYNDTISTEVKKDEKKEDIPVKKDDLPKTDPVKDKAKGSVDEKRMDTARESVDNSVIVPVPKISIAKQILETAKYSRFAYSRKVKFENKERTFLRFEQVGEKKDYHVVAWEDWPQIDDFNDPKTYILAFYKLVLKLEEMCQMVGMQEEDLDKDHNFWHKTKWSDVGIDIPKLFPLFHNVDDLRAKMNNRVFPNDTQEMKTHKKFFSCTDQLSMMLESLGNKRFDLKKMLLKSEDNITLLRKFFEQYLRCGQYHLKSLPDSYIPGFSIVELDVQSFDVYNEMADKSITLRDYRVGFMKDLIAKRITSSDIEFDKPFTAMLHILQIQTNTADARNTIPSSISQIDKEKVFHKLVSAFVVPKYSRISYVPKPMEEFDYMTLLDCFMYFLLVPTYATRDDDVRAVRNYVYYQFIRQFQDNVNVTFIPEHYVDYFSNYSASLCKDRNLRDALIKFFDKDRMANDGKNVSAPINGSFRPLLGRDRLFNYPFGGAINENRPLYTQFENFIALYELLKNVKFNNLFQKKYSGTIMALLNQVVINREHICRMAWRMTEIVRSVSPTAHAAPVDDEEFFRLRSELFVQTPKFAREEIPLNIGEMISLCLFPVTSEAVVKPLVMEDMLDGIRVAGWFNELATRYSYGKSVLRNDLPQFDVGLKIFKRPDYVDFAFENVGKYYSSPSSFSENFKSEIMTRWNLGVRLTVRMKSSEYIDRLKLLADFVNGRTFKFGFTQEVGISRFCSVEKHDNIRYYVYNNTVNGDNLIDQQLERTLVAKVFTLKDIVNEGNVFALKVEECMSKNQPIIIKLPYKFSFKKFFDNPNANDVLPIKVQQDSTAVQTMGFTIYYDIEPEYAYKKFYVPEIKKKPIVLPVADDSFNFTVDGDVKSFIISRMTMVERPSTNIKFFTIEELFKTIFYQQ